MRSSPPESLRPPAPGQALAVLAVSFVLGFAVWAWPGLAFELRLATTVALLAAAACGLAARRMSAWPRACLAAFPVAALLVWFSFGPFALGAALLCVGLALASAHAGERSSRLSVWLTAGLAALGLAVLTFAPELAPAGAVVPGGDGLGAKLPPLLLVLALFGAPILSATSSTPTPAVKASAEVRELEEALADARIRARTKTRFLSRMSHEIRTPLGGILGLSALLRQEQLSGGTRRRVKVIHESAQALLRIVNDAVDISRIEAGQLEIVSEPFDLRELVDQVMESAGVAAVAKSIELVPWLPPDLPRQRMGDVGRLRQVLINLAHNAIKFTQTGSVTVGIEDAGESAGESAVRLFVRDTGAGIADANVDRVLRTFAQVSSEDATQLGGAGLGLAIVRELVTRMGGELEVESQLGSGSTFACVLPLPRAEHPASNTSESAGLDLDGKRIALLCAWPQTSAFITRALRAWGGDVQVLARDAGLSATRGCACLIADANSSLAAKTSLPVLKLGASEPSLLNASGLAPIALPLTHRALEGALREMFGGRPRPPVSSERPSHGRPLLGVRVLIADDNAVNRMVAATTLERAGATTLAVEDGRAAVAAMQQTSDPNQRFDLALMDVQMPVLDGNGATKELRALGVTVPIVGLTAHVEPSAHASCSEAGMNCVMTKPYQPGDLVSLVVELTAARG